MSYNDRTRRNNERYDDPASQRGDRFNRDRFNRDQDNRDTYRGRNAEGHRDERQEMPHQRRGERDFGRENRERGPQGRNRGPGTSENACLPGRSFTCVANVFALNADAGKEVALHSVEFVCGPKVRLGKAKKRGFLVRALKQQPNYPHEAKLGVIPFDGCGLCVLSKKMDFEYAEDDITVKVVPVGDSWISLRELGAFLRDPRATSRVIALRASGMQDAEESRIDAAKQALALIMNAAAIFEDR
jgi:hypothetical protein